MLVHLSRCAPAEAVLIIEDSVSQLIYFTPPVGSLQLLILLSHLLLFTHVLLKEQGDEKSGIRV